MGDQVPVGRPKNTNEKEAAYKRQIIAADKTTMKLEAAKIRMKALEDKKEAERQYEGGRLRSQEG